MTGERTPNMSRDRSDIMAWIEFLGSSKTRDAWMKKALDTIKLNEALLMTIGKAGEIEKMHSEAFDLKNSVLTEIEKRETKLAGNREAFATEQAEAQAKISSDAEESGRNITKMETRTREALANAERAEVHAAESLAKAEDARNKAEADRNRAADLRADLESRSARVKELSEAL
jgi:hypothetical protein